MSFVQRTLTGLARPTLKWLSGRRLPQTSGRLALPGLQHPATLSRDSYGLVYITAQNQHDLFFAQGVAHAQDRLWQLELNRRIANGQLAEIIGKEALDLDKLTRTLGFARLAPATWEKLSPTWQENITAYTAGINAYLATEPPRPLEFTLLGFAPTPWNTEDTVAIGRLQAWALSRGWSHELVRAKLQEVLDPELAQEMGLTYPAGNPVTLPKGIELNQLITNTAKTAGATLLGKGLADGGGLGSNAWAIAPHRTTTGRAILANDPHLPLSTPGTWHLAHLHSEDGFQAAGASLPGSPGIMIGHNQHLAWGITLAFIDNEDLFIEQFHPHDPEQYLFQGQYRPVETELEIIEVKGEKPRPYRVRFTHHGPLISSVLPGIPAGLALQSVALQDNLNVAGLLELASARSWPEFQQAVSRIHAPTLNIVYADVEGNIGYIASGLVPVRANGRGDTPAPGWDGEHEWLRFLTPAEMPQALNPEQGYVVSCNQKIVGENYPHFLGDSWMNGYRAHRLEQIIQEAGQISPAACQTWSLDVVSLPGRALQHALAHLTFADPLAQQSYSLFQAWDGQLTAGSSGGLVYHVLLRQLAELILKPVLGEPLLHELLGHGPHPLLYAATELYGYWPPLLLEMLDNPQTQWLPAGVERLALLEQAFRATTEQIQTLCGPNPQKWQWGQLHQVSFPHAFATNPTLHPIFTPGPYPIGGDTDTVLQAGTLPAAHPAAPFTNNAFSVSYRQVWDMGHWDSGRVISAPGQSGHLASPHYQDLIPLWLKGEFLPLAWSKEAIAQQVKSQLQLEPN